MFIFDLLIDGVIALIALFHNGPGLFRRAIAPALCGLFLTLWSSVLLLTRLGGVSGRDELPVAGFWGSLLQFGFWLILGLMFLGAIYFWAIAVSGVFIYVRRRRIQSRDDSNF